MSLQKPEIGQDDILERIKIYLLAKHNALPKEEKKEIFEKELQAFFEAFSPKNGGGYCNGVSALWLYYQQIGKINWFNSTISLIMGKITEENFNISQLDAEERKKIDAFINAIELLQSPFQYIQTTQSDLARSFKALDKNLDLKQEYVITTFCSPGQQLTNLLAKPGLFQDQRMILVSGGEHATAIYCKEDDKKKMQLYCFDPNRLTLKDEAFSTDNMKQVGERIASEHEDTYLSRLADNELLVNQKLKEEIDQLEKQHIEKQNKSHSLLRQAIENNDGLAQQKIMKEMKDNPNNAQILKNAHQVRVISLKIFSFAPEPKEKYPEQSELIPKEFPSSYSGELKQKIIMSVLQRAATAADYKSLAYFLPLSKHPPTEQCVTSIARTGDIASMQVLLEHINKHNQTSAYAFAAAALPRAFECNHVELTNFILSYLHKYNSEKYEFNFKNYKLTYNDLFSNLKDINLLIEAVKNGNFEILDKVLIFSITHKTNVEIWDEFYTEPNSFKYLLHFNVYCNHETGALKQLFPNKNNPNLNNWFENIKFLNALDIRTRYFLLTYIQSFKREITQPQEKWNEELQQQIKQLDHAVIGNNLKQILFVIQTFLINEQDSNINYENIEHVMQKASALKEIAPDIDTNTLSQKII